ncbi:HEAT repeat domain-containing protein [bacterium]|nr:MAG: HEAT repeat domain-containing protein [bacterium]
MPRSSRFAWSPRDWGSVLPPNLLLEISPARAEAAIALAILAAVALAVGGLWLTRIDRTETQPSIPQAERELASAAPPVIPWWRAAGSGVPGDSAARTALADKLGARGDRDATTLLIRAWHEEREPDVRVAVLSALGWCDGETPLEIFDQALAEGDDAERILAIEGLERRGHYERIVGALNDASDVVALAAAHALHRGSRDDLLAGARAHRGEAFAAMLELLEL